MSDFIWTHLDGVRRVADVLDVVVAKFEVTAEEAGVDLVDFSLQLEAVGAVRRI